MPISIRPNPGATLLCALLLAPHLHPQVDGAEPGDREQLLRALRRERELALQELWTEADPARRAQALRRLAPPRDPPPRHGAWPDLEALIDAERALRGGPGPFEPGGWEQRLADSLALRVVPGAFEVREEGWGEPLTVHVEPLFGAPIPESVRLRLLWRSPEGLQEVARTEDVHPEAFARGFEMYLRAPLSAPGVWSLSPQVLRGEAEQTGLAAPVEAVDGLHGRLRSLEEGGLRAGGREGRSRALDVTRLLRAGVRLPALGAEGTLRLAEGVLLQGPGGAPVPAEPYFWRNELAGWLLGPSGARAGVLLVASPRARPEELLAGPAGAAWASAASSVGFELLATDLPLYSPVDGERPALALLSEVRAARGWRVTVVAVLGEGALLSGVALSSAPDRPDLAPDHLVLLHEAPLGPRPDPRLDLPVLSIEPLSPRSGEEELRPAGPPWRRLLRREPRLLVELELPGLVGALLGADPR